MLRRHSLLARIGWPLVAAVILTLLAASTRSAMVMSGSWSAAAAMTGVSATAPA